MTTFQSHMTRAAESVSFRAAPQKGNTMTLAVVTTLMMLFTGSAYARPRSRHPAAAVASNRYVQQLRTIAADDNFWTNYNRWKLRYARSGWIDDGCKEPRSLTGIHALAFSWPCARRDSVYRNDRLVDMQIGATRTFVDNELLGYVRWICSHHDGPSALTCNAVR